jgi:hypothetical protein
MNMLIGFVFGLAAHQTDRIYSRMENGTVWPRLFRFATGVVAAFPVFVFFLLSRPFRKIETPAHRREDILQTSVDFLAAFTAVGAGVVAGHVLDHLLEE